MQAPPFSSYLGMRILRKERGTAEVALDLEPHHLNRRGVAHGGVVTALLDSALGAAVISAIPEAWWCATTSLATQFIAGAGAGRLTATGRVLRRGRRVAFATGEVHDARDRLIASAHGTWHLWSRKPGKHAAVSGATRGFAQMQNGEALRVGKILAVGHNYAAHAAEMGAEPGRPPVFFLKPATALAGPGALALPTDAGAVHHEVELVVAISKDGRAIPREQALDHVLGYAVGLDLTLRDMQSEAKKRGEPWSLSKGFDGSAPVSPIVPRAEVGDGSGLSIALEVNGEQRQRGETSMMIADVPALIEQLSRRSRADRAALAPDDARARRSDLYRYSGGRRADRRR